MINVSFYGILNGLSDRLANNLDKIMITTMIGLSGNGIYMIMANFGVLISMPSRSLRKIASTPIAEAWKNNDFVLLSKVYHQASLHQFMLGSLLFVGLWTNIDNIFAIVGSEFTDGKYVLFFIALTHLIHMFAGVSGTILQNSPKYRWQTYSMGLFAICIVGFNLVFIPIYGIVGAALATFLSAVVFNFAKFLFLYFSYGFQPLNIKFALVISIAATSYGISYIIPQQNNFILDIILRSTPLVLTHISLMYFAKLSPDFNKMIDTLVSKVIKK